MAALLFVGVGFEVLLVAVTRHSEYQELEARTRALTRLIAERSVIPLVVNDRAELTLEVRRAIAVQDVVGAGVYGPDGSALTQRTHVPGLWSQLGPLPPGLSPTAVTVLVRRTTDGDVLDAVAPILRPASQAASLREARQIFGLAGDSPPSEPQLGWVRLVASTEQAHAAMGDAARLGLALLLLTLIVGLFVVSLYVGVIVRPLREAGDLAREIASGHLERRLPVRSADELGDLAGSMNTMAGALLEARRKAESEAEALRGAAAAMLSIARGARAAHDPQSVFQMVAHEVRRVTRCRAVALAAPPPHQTRPVFQHFDPPAPWGGITEGMLVPESLMEQLHDLPDGGLRLTPDGGCAFGESCAFCAGLTADGFHAGLVVPLQLPHSPPALLFVAAEEVEAFPAAERGVVVALTSHLSSALHAARLEERLEEAFVELQRAHDYLVHSEMLRVAGEMASGVAHDFNNVLGAILGRAELLARRIEAGTLSSEELLTSLGVIARAAEDGRETGRRLRQFGRGPLGAVTEPVDLHAVLDDAVEFTRPRWESEAVAAGHSIVVHRESEPGAWVAGRANELREVATNLILNAVDALPHGGAIRLAIRTTENFVLLTVADDGIGMDEETSRRLFEPFFTTKGQDGTGLGLAVVYGIVQRHGGSIEVVTRPGGGTRMELSFPRCAAPQRAEEAEGAPDELPALDVMVVDDEGPVRDVLRDIAAALGQRVTACASGEEALRSLRPGAFQLVLTDLGMPGMTGWDLARHVRDLDPDVTLVFVTGWGEDVDPRTAGEVGADLVLAKPFNVDDVARAIRLAAERRATRLAA
jgi:signal transduction histidine kinase/CheY-like chemotaxis protein